MAWKTPSLPGSPAPGNGLEKNEQMLNHEQSFHFAENMLILVKGDFPSSSGLRNWGFEQGNQDFGHYREVAHFKDPELLESFWEFSRHVFLHFKWSLFGFMFINISWYRNLAVVIASRFVCIHHATGLLILLGSCIIVEWRLDPNRTSTWNLFDWMLSSVKGCIYISTPISPEHLRRS